MKKILVVLADGFEEIEAITPIDVLRRAALEVVVAGLEKKEVRGARGVKIIAETTFNKIKEMPDAIVLPGGAGAKRLGRSKALKDLIVKMDRSGKLVAAICAAPADVLAQTGVLDGKRATCFPGCESSFGPRMTFVKDRVVRDGNIITSRGAGTAMEFALELVKYLVDEITAEGLARRMVV
jgi:4-methyl-5(b-hydroxyethyl)-thiazole monophosphate biosynthesis